MFSTIVFTLEGKEFNWFEIIKCSQNGLQVSFWEQLTHRQSALRLKTSGFIRFMVNLEKMIHKIYEESIIIAMMTL